MHWIQRHQRVERERPIVAALHGTRTLLRPLEVSHIEVTANQLKELKRLSRPVLLMAGVMISSAELDIENNAVTFNARDRQAWHRCRATWAAWVACWGPA